MKYAICLTIFTLAIFPARTLALDASHEVADLDCLKKYLHNANESQLEERYNRYDSCMTEYLRDLPSYKNIWLNVNSMDLKTVPVGLGFNPVAMAKKADRDIMSEVSKVRAARQNLVKITTLKALEQVDKNHQWLIPTDLKEIKPPSWAKKASDLK